MCIRDRASCSAVLLWLLRVQVGELFTADIAVQHGIKTDMWAACLVIPCHAVLMSLYGICVGGGKAIYPSLGTVLGYSVGIPLSWYLGFEVDWANHHLVGIWLGIAAALVFAAAWSGVTVACVDWSTLKPVDHHRVKQDEDPETLNDRLMLDQQSENPLANT
eukprot:TRINITY_DN19113_c0_g1_i2.p1 TRINITY_DN19113_c0_g1~~TRINITY_DN19113_c0_g1_i2.p1  ORF type:complete len:162 (+),score=38.14 TRINITY_DN19113_c0_g1_i2:191-676(+)